MKLVWCVAAGQRYLSFGLGVEEWGDDPPQKVNTEGGVQNDGLLRPRAVVV